MSHALPFPHCHNCVFKHNESYKMIQQILKQTAFSYPVKCMSVMSHVCPFSLSHTHTHTHAHHPCVYLYILAEQDRSDVLRKMIIFKENWWLSHQKFVLYFVKILLTPLTFMEVKNGNFLLLRK